MDSKRVGLYLRVSTDDQTVENQRQALVEATGHRKWRIVEGVRRKSAYFIPIAQPKKKSNMDCTFCMDCVHACPHDNVGLIGVVPGKDLWNGARRSSIGRFAERFDLTVLVLLLVFGALANAAGMIAPVAALLDRARFLFDLQRPVIIALFLGIAIFLIPAIIVYTAGSLSRFLGGIRVPLKAFISDFAMTMAPLGFVNQFVKESPNFGEMAQDFGDADDGEIAGIDEGVAACLAHARAAHAEELERGIAPPQGLDELRAIHFTGSLAGRDQDSHGDIVTGQHFEFGIALAE